MSKAIKKVASFATGGLIGGGTSLLGGVGKIASGKPKFQGATRKIDKEAFKIKESEEAAKRSRDLEKESAERSKQAHEQRQGLISQLQAQAAGEGPSLAEAQLRSAADRSLAQQLAAAQSQRGGSAGLRERQLLRGQAQAGREVAQDAATARMQERQMAQQLLGEQVQQEQALADQLTQSYLAQGFTIEQARQQAAADRERMETSQFLAAQGLSAESVDAAAKRQAGFIGGLFNAAGGIGAAAVSDKREKKKIKKASNKDFSKMISDGNQKKNIKKVKTKQVIEKEKSERMGALKENLKSDKVVGTMSSAFDGMKENQDQSGEGKRQFEKHKDSISDKNEKKNIKKDFLDKLQAYTYEYKNPSRPGAREGRQTSVMAQDLEKSSIGKDMVGQMEDGTKFVDYAKGYGAILAAQAHLNKRLDQLEKKSKKRK